MVTAVIAAAGLSSRMGPVNKMLLAYRSSTVAAHTVRRILDAGLHEVIVVAGHEADEVSEALAGLPVKVVVNEQYEKGLSSSLRAGVAAADGNGYMLCLADMVRIESGEYRQLAEAFEKQVQQDPRVICLPRYRGERGNPVIFSSFYRNELLAQVEGEGFRSVVQRHRHHIFWVEMDTPHVLEDLDSPGDYERLRQSD